MSPSDRIVRSLVSLIWELLSIACVSIFAGGLVEFTYNGILGWDLRHWLVAACVMLLGLLAKWQPISDAIGGFLDRRNLGQMSHPAVRISATALALTLATIVAAGLLATDPGETMIQQGGSGQTSGVQPEAEGGTEGTAAAIGEVTATANGREPTHSELTAKEVKEVLAEKLFMLPVEKLNFDLDQYRDHPHYDYERCDSFLTGHSGWHVQTKSVAGDLTADEKFYSLTSGRVIRIHIEKGKEGYQEGFIAVYDYELHYTAFYARVREALVAVGKDVVVGQELGIQGGGYRLSGTNDEHVHVEVQKGELSEDEQSKVWIACGARGTIDPIANSYLYNSVMGFDH